MTGLKSLLVTLAAVKAVKEHLAKVEETTKAAIKDEVGGRMGATGAVLPDGSEGGTVWITKPTHHGADPGGAAYVDNPALFMVWVQTVDPWAIVKSVRTTDVPRLLALAEEQMRTTGELPPGVGLTDPSPAYSSGGGVVSVKQSDEQRDNLIRAWQAGQISLPSALPQIEEADDAR